MPTWLLTKKSSFIPLGVLFFLTLAEFRIIYRLEGGADTLEGFGITEQRLLAGESNIKAWTNRILAPYMILGFHELTRVPWFSTTLFLSVIVLLSSNLVFFYLIQKFTDIDHALRYTVIYIFIFILIQHHYMFLWDLIDILIFTLFAYGILAFKSLHYFTVLFIVQIFNRESALFIAFYLFLDSFRWQPRLRLDSGTKLVTSIFLSTGGLLYVKFMRDSFYEGPARAYAYTGLPALIGNENHFWLNFKQFLANIYYFFISFNPNFNIIVNVFIVILIYYTYKYYKTRRPELVKASIILGLIIVSIFVSGIMMETRMWLITLPFILMMHAYSQSKPYPQPLL